MTATQPTRGRLRAPATGAALAALFLLVGAPPAGAREPGTGRSGRRAEAAPAGKARGAARPPKGGRGGADRSRGGAEKGRDARGGGDRAAPVTRVLTPVSGPPMVVNARQAIVGAGAAAQPAEAPGEKQFNECVKIPPHKRIKITLKPQSELMDLVAWISSMTCKKFIIPSNVHSNKITLLSPTPVSAREAYRAFLSALDAMSLTVVPAGKYLKVVPGNWAIQSSVPTFGDKERKRVPMLDQVVTQILRVRNVDVNELLLVLNKMKSRSGDVTAYKPTNTLIITDLASNLRRMTRVVEQLDVPVQGEKIWVVRLKHHDVNEVQKLLTQLFTARGPQAAIPQVAVAQVNPGKPPNPEAARAAAAAAAEARAAAARDQPVDESRLTASKILADPTTNSLIIVASPLAFARIASLLRRVDVKDRGVGQKVHVYYLENATAEEMARTLAGLTGAAAGPRRGPGGKATLFKGNVKVSADKATNSLVIVADTRDYLNLIKVIRRLDIPRRQVFVEAWILEITLNKERKLGFSYHGGGITGSGKSETIIFGGVQHSGFGSIIVDPLSLMGLAVGARGATIDGSGRLLGLPTDIPGFGVMFQALQTNSDVNVLSSPHILTTDNKEAEISVGQNIPFQGALLGGGLGGGALAGLAGQAGQAGQQGQNLAALGGLFPSVSIQRQDVALKLKITPHVNDSDMVRLKISQEVSDIASPNFNNLGPSTTKRTAKTTVVVRDQQTVVIGGLMSDRVNNTVSKVPLLGDIPILGYLFKHKTKTMQKTNLLIVLTPYVIRDQSDLRRIFRRKLAERREFIERYTAFKDRPIGGDIDYRHKRGLLAEINKVGARAEHEARLLERARRATEQKVEGLDLPPGMGTGGASRGRTPGATPTGAVRLQPKPVIR